MNTHTLRRFWPAITIVVIAAVTAGVLVLGGDDDTLQARVGQNVEGRFNFRDDVDVTARTLRLPFGEIDIETTAPQSTAPSNINLDDWTAPDGGSFVGVRVKRDPNVTLKQPAVTDVADARVAVALRVGGRSYPVPAGFRDGTSDPVARYAWVAVAGTSRDIAVAITYDGVTQSVSARSGTRTTGAAAPLYRLRTSATPGSASNCGTPVVSDGFRVDPDGEIRCQVLTIGAVPYLPGRGWATKGTTWFAVLVGLFDYARFERAGLGYRAVAGGSGPVVTASAPGTQRTAVPQVTPVDYLPGGARARLAVVAVPAGTTPTITLAATYRDLIGSDTPDNVTVATGPTTTATWTVTP